MQKIRAKHAFSITAVVLFVLIVIFAARNKHTEPSSPQSTPSKLVFAIGKHPPSALVLIAKNQRFFEKHGIDISFKDYPSGVRSLAGMLAGEAQMANAADVPIATQTLITRDFKIIASIASADNDARIVARRDHGISAPIDLRNKRIGVQKLSSVHYFLHAFLLSTGIHDKEVTTVYLKAEELAPALIRGEIDAFSMREPYVRQALDGLHDKAIVFSKDNLVVRGEMLVARNDFLATHKEDAKAVARALIDAEEFSLKFPEPSIEIVAQELQANGKDIAESWPEMHLGVVLSQASLLQLEIAAQWALPLIYGNKSNQPSNILNFIDARVLEEVRPQSVTFIHESDRTP